MYIDDLLSVFEKALSEFSANNNQEVLDLLREEIVAKKYDTQDEGLIEAILREDKKDLVEPLIESLKERTSGLDVQQKEEFFSDEGIKKEAINIFIASLEHLINYYYNNVIGKHFSSS